MNDRLLRLYHALPYPLRCAAASARGWQLRGWRYGSDTERSVEEALNRETWSVAQWRTWTSERLDRFLRRAKTCVPHYREYWAKHGKNAAEELAQWPLLEKEQLRANGRAFLADDCDVKRMFCDRTSGTTGTPLTIWQSLSTVREWYALFEARWRRWYGLSCHDRWAIIGGQLVTPAGQERPPFWVWNYGLNQLYLSAYHITPRNTAHYVAALQKHRVSYLWTYSSSAQTLAQFIIDQNLRPPELAAVITNAEPLHEHQRKIIEQAFRCPVYQTYGMNEMVCAASECRHGRLHLWPEVGIQEVLSLNDSEQVAPGAQGRLVSTGLVNLDMPLVRYETGDVVVMAHSSSPCPCGRNLPILDRVEGRQDDLIITADGRQVARFGAVFAGIPLVESQVIQESMSALKVLVVPAHGFTREHAALIERRLNERFQSLAVVVEESAALPRGSNGKLKAVISRVAPAGRGAS